MHNLFVNIVFPYIQNVQAHTRMILLIEVVLNHRVRCVPLDREVTLFREHLSEGGVRGERKLEVCVKVRAECRRKTYKNTARRKVSQIKH